MKISYLVATLVAISVTSQAVQILPPGIECVGTCALTQHIDIFAPPEGRVTISVQGLSSVTLERTSPSLARPARAVASTSSSTSTAVRTALLRIPACGCMVSQAEPLWMVNSQPRSTLDSAAQPRAGTVVKRRGAPTPVRTRPRSTSCSSSAWSVVVDGSSRRGAVRRSPARRPPVLIVPGALSLP